MNRIESQVKAARRRLILGKLGRALCVTLFAAAVIAAVAIAVPAVWVVDVAFDTWVTGWIIASAVTAVLAAAAYALATAPTKQAVAAEVDRRFGLRERLSSSLSLDPRSRESGFGSALVADAEKRAGQLAVAERFSLRPSRWSWLPVSVVPVLAIVVLLAEPAQRSTASSRTAAEVAETEQVKTAASQLKKRIQQQRRKAEAEGLKEAQELFEKLEADLDKIAQRDKLDRKEAMIELNDLKKQLEERREQLGTPDQMRRAMAQMEGLESGPAEKTAKAIQRGEFDKAREMVKELADKLRDGKLSEDEKKQLKKQVEQIKKQLEQAAEQHEQKKKDLQRQIEQARREGRKEEAAEMQQKLNQLQAQDGQMQQMRQMAEALGGAAQAMQQGDGAQAADALEALSGQLGELQEEMSELEDLDAALDQFSQSKNQMRCQKCGGGGCQGCQGFGGMGQQSGNGMGEGPGYGDRPESDGDTNTYETQVRGNVKRGKAVIAGFADGPNRKGISREDVKRAVEGALSEQSDPLENQTLPRDEREQTQQYFDRLREGG